MPTINDVCQFLDRFAPVRLAEDWDNVGLLAGDPESPVQRIMTCLTITPESASEAISKKADLIVSHHPLPFRPIKKITTHSTGTRLLWELVRNGVAVYSPHTGFDSSLQGINQSLGQKLGLSDLRPIRPIQDDPQQLGAGRIGSLPQKLPFEQFISNVKDVFELNHLQCAGKVDHVVSKVAIACGSGGSFLADAIEAGCDTFVTGETNFHTALEVQAQGVAMLLLGHFHSERFAVEMLAGELNKEMADTVHVWACESEADPVRFV